MGLEVEQEEFIVAHIQGGLHNLAHLAHPGHLVLVEEDEAVVQVVQVDLQAPDKGAQVDLQAPDEEAQVDLQALDEEALVDHLALEEVGVQVAHQALEGEGPQATMMIMTMALLDQVLLDLAPLVLGEDHQTMMTEIMRMTKTTKEGVPLQEGIMETTTMTVHLVLVKEGTTTMAQAQALVVLEEILEATTMITEIMLAKEEARVEILTATQVSIEVFQILKTLDNSGKTVPESKLETTMTTKTLTITIHPEGTRTTEKTIMINMM